MKNYLKIKQDQWLQMKYHCLNYHNSQIYEYLYLISWIKIIYVLKNFKKIKAELKKKGFLLKKARKIRLDSHFSCTLNLILKGKILQNFLKCCFLNFSIDNVKYYLFYFTGDWPKSGEYTNISRPIENKNKIINLHNLHKQAQWVLN